MEFHPQKLGVYKIEKYEEGVGTEKTEGSFSELLEREMIKGKVKYRGRGRGNLSVHGHAKYFLLF